MLCWTLNPCCSGFISDIKVILNLFYYISSAYTIFLLLLLVDPFVCCFSCSVTSFVVWPFSTNSPTADHFVSDSSIYLTKSSVPDSSITVISCFRSLWMLCIELRYVTHCCTPHRILLRCNSVLNTCWEIILCNIIIYNNMWFDSIFDVNSYSVL